MQRIAEGYNGEVFNGYSSCAKLPRWYISYNNEQMGNQFLIEASYVVTDAFDWEATDIFKIRFPNGWVYKSAKRIGCGKTASFIVEGSPNVT